MGSPSPGPSTQPAGPAPAYPEHLHAAGHTVVVIDQRGPWNLAAPELGQQAGIFTKHGIILDLKYSEADKEAVVKARTARA